MSARLCLRSLGRTVATVSGGLLLGGWTLPEHRDISAAALEQLTPERRLVFDKAWETATGQRPEMNACAQAVDPGGVAGTCLDLAM